MFDVHIYGVRSRAAMVEATARKLSVAESNVHYDDRPNGGHPIYTAKKAWAAPVPNGITHRIVLQDDVEVCDDFLSLASRIAERHPKVIIGFFPYCFMERNTEIEQLPTPYFIADILSACGIMMPVEYIQPCFDFITEKYGDACTDDGAIQEWATQNHIRILTTIPALIQHIGDDSVYYPDAPIRRTVYYSRNPQANWGSREIAEYRLREWFFSNHGKPRTHNKGVLNIVPE